MYDSIGLELLTAVAQGIVYGLALGGIAMLVARGAARIGIDL